MKFDRDQTFSLNECCTIQHFFCFPGCCMMLYSFGHPMQLCCTLLYSFLKKCCIVLCEMLHSFGHPSVEHDQPTYNNVHQMFYDVLWNVVLVWPGLECCNKSNSCNKPLEDLSGAVSAYGQNSLDYFYNIFVEMRDGKACMSPIVFSTENMEITNLNWPRA